MAVKEKLNWLTDEIADFLASCPEKEQLLDYHPSARVQERARALLHKIKNRGISTEEQRELDQFEYAEMLMQLVKARLRARKVSY